MGCLSLWPLGCGPVEIDQRGTGGGLQSGFGAGDAPALAGAAAVDDETEQPLDPRSKMLGIGRIGPASGVRGSRHSSHGALRTRRQAQLRGLSLLWTTDRVGRLERGHLLWGRPSHTDDPVAGPGEAPAVWPTPATTLHKRTLRVTFIEKRTITLERAGIPAYVDFVRIDRRGADISRRGRGWGDLEAMDTALDRARETDRTLQCALAVAR
jgi:hypothetical protein